MTATFMNFLVRLSSIMSLTLFGCRANVGYPPVKVTSGSSATSTTSSTLPGEEERIPNSATDNPGNGRISNAVSFGDAQFLSRPMSDPFPVSVVGGSKDIGRWCPSTYPLQGSPFFIPSYCDLLDETLGKYKAGFKNTSGTGVQWTIKVGQSGDIYSINHPNIGELISKQVSTAGQWVDQTMQMTFHVKNSVQREGCDSSVVDTDIHMAGYYMMSDYNCRTLYYPTSKWIPLSNWAADAANGVIKFDSWPQYAHNPHVPEYNSNKLLMQDVTYTNKGRYIKISFEVNKYIGGDDFRSVVAPHLPLRRGTINYFKTKNGSITPIANGISGNVTLASTGGYVAFLNSNSSEAGAIALIAGTQENSFFNYRDIDSEYDTKRFRASISRVMPMTGATTMKCTFYLAFGYTSNIEVIAQEALSIGDAGCIVAQHDDSSEFVQVYYDSSKKKYNREGAGAPAFKLFKYPSGNYQPVFWMVKSDNTCYLSHYPNIHCPGSDINNCSITQGPYFLGWVTNQEKAEALNGTAIAGIVPSTKCMTTAWITNRFTYNTEAGN